MDTGIRSELADVHQFIFTLQALLTNCIFYCMNNLGVGGEVVKVVILILGLSSEGLVGS